MKINIKNLKGQVFSVDIDPTNTIAQLKERIQAQKGHPVDSQKIIFKGKTTTNEETIEKLALKETDFLVVMTQVAKPQPKSKVEEKPEPKKEEKKQQKKEEKKEAPKQQEPVQNEAQINELMSMGFAREQCVAALKAAFNNSQRAVQYLLNGLPAGSNQGAPGGQGQVSGNLQALASLPQFEMIRQAVQQDPNALPLILEQLATTSPEIYNLISQHPEEFEQLLLGGEGEFDEQQEGEEGAEGEIVVSQQEQEAINRLAALGFSKIQAAQAYIACDKNEELAANLLFDRLANGDIEQSFPGAQGHPGGQDEDDDNLFN